MIVWRCKHIRNSKGRPTHSLSRSIESDDEGQRCFKVDDCTLAITKGADPALSRLAVRLRATMMIILTPGSSASLSELCKGSQQAWSQGN
jgi:hypothetical protein